MADLKVQREWWFDRYTGTAEELVAAGLVRVDQLPGQPGGPKTMCTFYGGEPVGAGVNRVKDERWMCVRRLSPKRFSVDVGLLEAERNRRDVALRRTIKAERIEQADPEAYRQQCITLLALTWQAAVGTARDADYPYPFVIAGPEGDRLQLLVRELFKIVTRAPVKRLTPTSPEVGAARDDAAFQSFMKLQGLRGHAA